jgi:hypothetical protein
MRTRATSNLILLALLAGAGTVPSLVGGCGGSNKPSETPADTSAAEPPPASNAPPLDIPPAAAEPPPAGSASSAPVAAAPLGVVLFKDNDQIQKLYDAASAAPQATLDSKPKATDPIVKGIKAAAAKYAKDMTPDGPLARGKLTEKQHLQADITLQPGKCYKLIGFGTPQKVKDFDLQLFVGGILSAQDTTDDNVPIVNRDAPLCPSGDNSTTYKLDLYVEKGAGDVGVQLYSKAK